jgi:hypothetical protein
MVEKSDIEKNLQRIDQLYQGSSSNEDGQLYSKMAMLELCGWIETSMDDIVLSVAKRLILDSKHLKYLDDVVGRVYGFEYQKHFRQMVLTVIGLQGVETMERKVNPAVFLPMQAVLRSLKPNRDHHAHGYLKGTTPRLDAPSVTLNNFHVVYAGLLDIESVLKSIK